MSSKYFLVRWLWDFRLQRTIGESFWVALRDSYHNACQPTFDEILQRLRNE